MSKIWYTVLGVIAGWVVGSLINMGLIQLGYLLFPIEGVDTNDFVELSRAMPRLGVKHFIFPFLAHALGTLIGAITAVYISKQQYFTSALIVGIIFLAGGIAMTTILDAPFWFELVDLLLAYIPMAWLGAIIGMKLK